MEAARLLADLAKEETEKRSSPLRIKKLYVLSALLVEEHLKNVKKNAKGAGVRSSALIGLVDGDGGGGTGEEDTFHTTLQDKLPSKGCLKLENDATYC